MWHIICIRMNGKLTWNKYYVLFFTGEDIKVLKSISLAISSHQFLSKSSQSPISRLLPLGLFNEYGLALGMHQKAVHGECPLLSVDRNITNWALASTRLKECLLMPSVLQGQVPSQLHSRGTGITWVTSGWRSYLRCDIRWEERKERATRYLTDSGPCDHTVGFLQRINAVCFSRAAHMAGVPPKQLQTISPARAAACSAHGGRGSPTGWVLSPFIHYKRSTDFIAHRFY